MDKKPKTKKDETKESAQIQGLKNYNPKLRKEEIDRLRKELGIK